MDIKEKIGGVLGFVAYYPIFIVGFLVLASIFNLQLNGLIYLIGILLTSFACWRLSLIIPDDNKQNELLTENSAKGVPAPTLKPATFELSNGQAGGGPTEDNSKNKQKFMPYCGLFGPLNNIKNPSIQAAITWFTFIYLLIPMLMNKKTLLNPAVITVTTVLAVFNCIYLGITECSNYVGLLFGTIIGLICGTVWYFIILGINKKYLFYNELISNNAICNKPSQTNFKCHVYKGGELVSSNIV